MVTKAVRFLSAVALVSALWLCVGCGSGAEKSAKRYIAALQRYDVETLRKMIAPDVIVTSGRSRVRGPDQLLEAVDFQAGIRTTYECERMVVRGDTVDVDLLEKSEFSTALGIPETLHYERLVFVKGMLTLRELRKPTLEYQAYGEQIRRLKSWIQENHPDVMAQIEDPKTGFKRDRATGELLVRMAREWREGQPAE
jgi:hypothetical protein